MASWHLAELQHFSPITKILSRTAEHFSRTDEHFSVAFDVISTVAVNPQLNDFSGEALFRSAEVFFQILEKQHFATAFDLFQR